MDYIRTLGRFFLILLCLFTLKISAVDINRIELNQTGALKVPEELLKYNLSLQEGDKFSETALNDDIKRLYDTGYFSDVEVNKENTKDGKVNLVFNLANTPIINKISIVGNKRYDKERLMEGVVLQDGDSLDAKKLQESTASIKGVYQSNGYYGATVYPETVKLKKNKINLIFKVDENMRYKINSVSFKGNSVFSSFKLRQEIETSHSYLNWIFDWGLYNKDTVKDDDLRLRNLYWTKGYLDFKVDSKVEPLKKDSDYVNVVFDIFEGKPYKVNNIVVNGEHVFTKKEIMSMILLQKGQVYDVGLEQQSIQMIEGRYARLGYSDFSLKTHLDTDYKNHKVDVVFNMNEGRPYTIRNVNIKGNKITKDYVIRRELPVEPGKPVDKVMIDAGKSRLMAMNYFKEVKSYTTNSSVPGEKNVNYDVEEKGTAHASIGAGYSTNNSFVGRLTLSESNFDLFSPSTYFRGGGQRLDLMAQAGLRRMDFALNFSDPWLFGIPLRLDTTAFFNTRKYEFWDERHMGFKVGLEKPFGDFNSVGLNYKLDFIRMDDMSTQYSEALRNAETGDSRQGMFQINLKRDTRDSIMNPRSGYLLKAMGELNSEATGGSSNFYRWELSGDHYYSFLDDFFTVHSKLKYGIIQGIGSGNYPMYNRYFIGGLHSIRGFQFRRVGPMNENGAPLGGQTMLVGTVEVIHPIYKWISGSPFVDVGNSWENPYSLDYNLNVGAGYGFRLTLPQFNNTPLRFDIGYPVYRTSSQYSDSVQFYFDLGVDW